MATEAVDTLRKNAMMRHLLDALDGEQDIGHYGRLVFAIVAHHFMSPEELFEHLTKDPSCDEDRARALVDQVESRDYNPPRREKILEYQQEQDFSILPDDDPDAGNVYRDLEFPEHVYEQISEYHRQQADV